MITYAFTGHRPPTIFGEDDPYSWVSFQQLTRFASVVLAENKVERVISGMALGWDQAVAAAAIHLNIPFIAAIPFKNHGSNWPERSQQFHKDLLVHAEKIETRYGYTDRDHWMVDNGQKLIALASGVKSGTSKTVDYAERKIGSENIINVWPQWLEFRSQNK